MDICFGFEFGKIKFEVSCLVDFYGIVIINSEVYDIFFGFE